MCWRLPEPVRGSADRAHVTGTSEMEASTAKSEPLSRRRHRHLHGTMFRGLRDDLKTILKIPTMRYALVGVSNIFFVVTAVSTWMPTFYQRQFGLTQGKANLAFGALVVVAGIPAPCIGGVVSDRWVKRVHRGTHGHPRDLPRELRGPLPHLVHPDALRLCLRPIELSGLPDRRLVAPGPTGWPADAVPAQLRSTGSGAFNVASIIFGSAAAPLLTSGVATAFGGNYRVAFSIVMPSRSSGPIFLFRAPVDHIEADSGQDLRGGGGRHGRGPQPGSVEGA